MTRRLKRIMISALAVMLVLPFFPQLQMQANADAPMGTISVTNEFAIWRQLPDDEIGFHLYNGYDGGTVTNRDGFSYNKETNTMTISNVNDLDQCYCVDAYDMGDLKIQVTGTNKIARFSANDNTSFTFQGTGSLELSPYQEYYPDPKNKKGEPENKGHIMGYGLVSDGKVHVGKSVTLILNSTDYGDEYDASAEITSNEAVDTAGLMKNIFTYEGKISATPTVRTEKSDEYEFERPVTVQTRYIAYKFPATYQEKDTEFDPAVNDYVETGTFTTYGNIFKKKDTGDFYINSLFHNVNNQHDYMVKLEYDEGLKAWREKIEEDPKNPGFYVDAYDIRNDDALAAMFEEITDVSQLPDGMVGEDGMIDAYLRNESDTDYEIFEKGGARYALVMGNYYNFFGVYYAVKPAAPEHHYGLTGYAAGAAVFKVCKEAGVEYLDYVDEIPIYYGDYNYYTTWKEALEKYLTDNGYEKKMETVKVPASYTYYITNKVLKFSPVPKQKTAQSMKVSTKTKTVKYKKVKKKAQTVSGAIKVSNAKGTVTYAKVSKGSDKKLSINKKTGKITVKKGAKKGKHKIVVNVKAAGNGDYLPATKKVTVTIKVK